MARSGVKFIPYGNNSKKVNEARAAVNRAAAVLRARGAQPMAPPSTRGFYGGYSNFRRGGGNRPELKFVDVVANNVAVAATWTITLVNGIATGTDITNRVGRKMQMKSILFRSDWYNATGNNVSVAQGASGRCVIIYDAQPNSGAAPVGTDIFTTQTIQAPMNLNNRDRFKVLKDFTYTINAFSTGATGILATGDAKNTFRKVFKKLNLETIFSGVGATQGDISTGAVYICTCSDIANASYTDWASRIRFIDN